MIFHSAFLLVSAYFKYFKIVAIAPSRKGLRPSNLLLIYFKKQINFYVNLLKKVRKYHFANLDVNSVLDNRKFWQNVKPIFSN